MNSFPRMKWNSHSHRMQVVIILNVTLKTGFSLYATTFIINISWRMIWSNWINHKSIDLFILVSNCFLFCSNCLNGIFIIISDLREKIQCNSKCDSIGYSSDRSDTFQNLCTTCPHSSGALSFALLILKHVSNCDKRT